VLGALVLIFLNKTK